MMRAAPTFLLLATLLALDVAAGVPLAAQVVVAPAPRGWIGVSFEMQTTREGSSSQTVTRVTDVLDGSPAAAAGVRPGDVVVSINGRDAGEGFTFFARSLRPGDPVGMVVERNGRRQELRITAGARPVEAPAPPEYSFTFRADSMVDRLYRAMDSLRVSMTEDDGLRVRVAEARRAADSMAWQPFPPGEMVFRLRRSGPERVITVAPFDPPEPHELTGVVVPEVRAPFGFYIFRGEGYDSLRSEMDALNREIQALRTRQTARARELARAPRTEQGRVAANEAELRRLNTELADLGHRADGLRRAMEVAARREAQEQQDVVIGRIAPDRAPVPTSEFRPLDPYLLGQNRAAGAEVVDLRPELAEYFKVDGGVLVVDVPPGTPADLAGIQPGDVVTRVDGTSVRSITELRRGLAAAPPELPLTLVRKGRTVQVLLRR
jgi:hypothetical protein